MSKSFSLAYFAGGSEITIYPYKALIGSKHKINIVLTKIPKKVGRGKKTSTNILAKEVIKDKVPLIMINDFKELETVDLLKKKSLDFIIVFSFGIILPKELLKIPKYGCINIHTSLLPKWRGASPVQHALLNNEKETGYTLIIMNEKMDEGNIIFKKIIIIEDHDNYASLIKKIVVSASNNLVKIIEQIVENKITIEKQDSKKASYCYRIRKEDTYLSFKETAKNIIGKIRAFSPYPGAKCFINGELVKILEAKVEGKEVHNKKFGIVKDKNLLISCKFGFIRLVKVQRSGKKPMLVKDLLNGWKISEGTVVNDNKG